MPRTRPFARFAAVVALAFAAAGAQIVHATPSASEELKSIKAERAALAVELKAARQVERERKAAAQLEKARESLRRDREAVRRLREAGAFAPGAGV